ncbi:MAG: hypothetical protein ACK5XO_11160, partial [Phycisphaerales bacterium]
MLGGGRVFAADGRPAAVRGQPHAAKCNRGRALRGPGSCDDERVATYAALLTRWLLIRSEPPPRAKRTVRVELAG